MWAAKFQSELLLLWLHDHNRGSSSRLLSILCLLAHFRRLLVSNHQHIHSGRICDFALVHHGRAWRATFSFGKRILVDLDVFVAFADILHIYLEGLSENCNILMSSLRSRHHHLEITRVVRSQDLHVLFVSTLHRPLYVVDDQVSGLV